MVPVGGRVATHYCGPIGKMAENRVSVSGDLWFSDRVWSIDCRNGVTKRVGSGAGRGECKCDKNILLRNRRTGRESGGGDVRGWRRVHGCRVTNESRKLAAADRHTRNRSPQTRPPPHLPPTSSSRYLRRDSGNRKRNFRPADRVALYNNKYIISLCAAAVSFMGWVGVMWLIFFFVNICHNIIYFIT